MASPASSVRSTPRKPTPKEDPAAQETLRLIEDGLAKINRQRDAILLNLRRVEENEKKLTELRDRVQTGTVDKTTQVKELEIALKSVKEAEEHVIRIGRKTNDVLRDIEGSIFERIFGCSVVPSSSERRTHRKPPQLSPPSNQLPPRSFVWAPSSRTDTPHRHKYLSKDSVNPSLSVNSANQRDRREGGSPEKGLPSPSSPSSGCSLSPFYHVPSEQDVRSNLQAYAPDEEKTSVDSIERYQDILEELRKAVRNETELRNKMDSAKLSVSQMCSLIDQFPLAILYAPKVLQDNFDLVLLAMYRRREQLQSEHPSGQKSSDPQKNDIGRIFACARHDIRRNVTVVAELIQVFGTHAAARVSKDVLGEVAKLVDIAEETRTSY